MILKVLLIIAVISIVYFLFIKKKPTVSDKTRRKKTTRDTDTDTNEMVVCETCGVYVAIDETILSASKYYCSQECLKKAK